MRLGRGKDGLGAADSALVAEDSGRRQEARLTGGVEGRCRAIRPAVLHGKHLHKLLLEDRQQVRDTVVQTHIEDELDRQTDDVKTSLPKRSEGAPGWALAPRHSGCSKALSQ